MEAKLSKSQNNAKQYKLFLIILITFCLFSCSHEVVSEQEMVTKKEYDELKKKYDDLLADKNASVTSEITVDLKDENPKIPTEISQDPLEQIADLEVAQAFISEGEFGKALDTLKKQENSEIKQIKVRVKYLQGEIFFAQKEWDLAMQKYDEIITGYGFSSMAINAIEKKDACIKNLNKPFTQEPYHTIFKNFTQS